MRNRVGTLLLAGALVGFAHLSHAEPGEHFIVRDTSRSAEDVVASIRDYVAENDDWIYLSDFGLKGGEVTAVKVCYLPIGKHIFAAGMHVAAMMPCGHIAVYETEDGTQMSMLHPRFMTTLYPDPNLEIAVSKATPAFEAMLETVWE
jgi:hypothetical protein